MQSCIGASSTELVALVLKLGLAFTHWRTCCVASHSNIMLCTPCTLILPPSHTFFPQVSYQNKLSQSFYGSLRSSANVQPRIPVPGSAPVSHDEQCKLQGICTTSDVNGAPHDLLATLFTAYPLLREVLKHLFKKPSSASTKDHQ
jgi:hypothetical protein